MLVANVNLALHGLDRSPSVPAEGGLYLPHPSGTVIQAEYIGRNVTVQGSVTIGMRAEQAFPTLEDGVFVGAGARVLGSMRIGRDARIGANAVVLEAVPDGCTAVGVPARIVTPPHGEQ